MQALAWEQVQVQVQALGPEQAQAWALGPELESDWALAPEPVRGSV